MATTTNSISTPLDIVNYYSNLLINQYNGLPKATATLNALCGMAIQPQTSVQTISFSSAPTSGTFVLSYNGNSSSTIHYSDAASTIQTNLQAVTGLSQVTVTGSIANQLLTVTFVGVIPPALSLQVVSNSLELFSSPVSITIVETDVTLPLAVMNGYNIIPDFYNIPIASGVALDVIGEYVGVQRSGNGFTNFITLNDSEFLNLIQMAIIQNHSGSSMLSITTFLNRFFGEGIYVYDNLNMTMTFLISNTLITNNTLQLLINEGLLPVPMGVLGIVIISPVPLADLFVMTDASNPIPPVGGGNGMTDAADPDLTGHWLMAEDFLA